jgi:hypothetical protein
LKNTVSRNGDMPETRNYYYVIELGVDNLLRTWIEKVDANVISTIKSRFLANRFDENEHSELLIFLNLAISC